MSLRKPEQPWVPKTAEDFIMRARAWDRQCRRFRDAGSELPAGLYPLARRIAFESRRKARELMAE